MASLTGDEDEDDDDKITEVFVQDAAPRNKKVQAMELKSGRLIGKGQSSIVYETMWRGKRYARKDFLRVPSDVFEREAAVLAALDEHPNVTRTHCWTVNEGSCSLVMDLMDDDLQNVMRNRRESACQRSSRPNDDTSHLIDLHMFIEDAKKNSPERPVASTWLVSSFSMSEALHFMLQNAEGILFLHEHGVPHGDLKPKNILVSPSGSGGPSLKVADFGLVGTKMKSKTLVSQRARKLEIARWRAPELFDMSYVLREDEHDSDSDWDSDSGDHDGGVHTYGKLSRADVYSFAVTCSQILTGEVPYSGLGLRELVSKISGPNSLRPGLPQRCLPQLSDLINKCWGDELKRPTFIDIISELRDLQASLTTDSYVQNIRTTTISGPEFEVTVSVKFFSEKIAKKRYSELTSSNPVASTLPRGDLEVSEAVGLPMKADTFSIKSNEESSKSTLVPNRRRRWKVYGCLGCVPVKSTRRKENIPNLKEIMCLASKKSPIELGRTIGAKLFTYAEVTTMTRNYKIEIGRGGFGPVYYGQLPDGQEVAVKVGTSRQLEQEFFNEIELLSRVRHKNLVALVGYCQENNHYVLIYEYMKNGSVYDHLHEVESCRLKRLVVVPTEDDAGNLKGAGILDLKMRLQIALNVAQALEYLHTGIEPSFVHGDMKSSNVLLSSLFDAKVSDFGLTIPTGGYTYSISNVKGTAGYLDPEYYFTNTLSPRTDIFSFGVVLLELLTGRPPFLQSASSTRQESLCDWVRAALHKGDIDMVLDPALIQGPNQEALWKVAELAMRCVEPRGVYRPTLSEVIYELHQAINLSVSTSMTGPSVTQTEPPKPISLPGISWTSEKLQTKENPDLDSPSTRRPQKPRRGKASNLLRRLSRKPAEPVIEEVSAGTQGRRAENVQKIGGAKAYTYAEVTAMTWNFKTVIGKGGFGPIYYGELPSGREVAVKVGDDGNSKQGAHEFLNEIEVLSRLHHKNLVSLLGYCRTDKHYILIYEYMKNGSLRDHLHGNAQRTGILGWKVRLDIAINVAQGLEYMHTGCIPQLIHRDMKSSNILLSENFNAKVADFGFSKMIDLSMSNHVTTMVMGSVGYLDPEYYSTNFLTGKSDVYSFGVVLLELITGRPPVQRSGTPYRILPPWVRSALQVGDIDMVLDPALKSSVPAPNLEALWKVADLAMRCVEPQARHRPKIDEVVQQLCEAMVLESQWEL